MNLKSLYNIIKKTHKKIIIIKNLKLNLSEKIWKNKLKKYEFMRKRYSESKNVTFI
jgi:hypothetical protein